MITIVLNGTKLHREAQILMDRLGEADLSTRLVHSDEVPNGDVAIVGPYKGIPACRPLTWSGGRLIRIPLLGKAEGEDYVKGMSKVEEAARVARDWFSGWGYELDASWYKRLHPIEVIDWLESLPPEARITFDIETTGLEPQTCELVSIAMLCLGQMVVCHREDSHLLTIDDVFGFLHKMPNPLTACNATFEQEWFFVKCGTTGNVDRDPMVDDALVNEEGYHALDMMAGYVDCFGYDIPMREWLKPYDELKPVKDGNKHRRNEHKDADPALLCRYNCDDVYVTALVNDYMRTRLKREPRDQEVVRQWMVRGQACLARMKARGMYIDPDSLAEVIEEQESNIDLLLDRINGAASNNGMSAFNVKSAPQKQELLFGRMKLPVYKLTNKRWVTAAKWRKDWWKGQGQPSTDAESLEMTYRATKDDTVKAMMDLNSEIAIRDGILSRCEKVVAGGDGFIRSNLSLTKLVTGQISSTEPPMQNVPKTPMRRIFRSRFKNGYILEIDYSQLHLRIIGNLAKCDGFITAYRDGVDLHARTAAGVILHEPEEDVLAGLALGDEDYADARDKAKRTNFSIIFEIGARALALKLGVEEAEAKRYISGFNSYYPEIPEQIERQHRFAERHGYVVSPMGRIRHLPGVWHPNRYSRLRALRQAGDFLISNSGRYITLYSMVMADEYMTEHQFRSCLVMQVHDSVIFDCHPDELDDVLDVAQRFCVDEIGKICDWMEPIPLVMDGFAGPSWHKDEKEYDIGLS